MKACSTCKKEQPSSQYSVCSKVKSGLNARCKTCERLRHKKDYESNKDYNLEWAKKHRATNHGHRLEIERKSRYKNKEKIRPAKNARQRIRNKVIQGGVYLILNKELRKVYNSPCFQCGSMKDQSLDHIIPISRGGSHSVGNIMTLCLPCNKSKNAKLLVEWRNQN